MRFSLQSDEDAQRVVALLPTGNSSSSGGSTRIEATELPPPALDALMLDLPWSAAALFRNATDAAYADFVVDPAAAIAASLSPEEISRYNTTLREAVCPSSICFDVSQLGFFDSDACICNDQLTELYDSSKDARNSLGVAVAGAFVLLTGLVLVLPAAASNLVNVRLRTELAGGGMQAVVQTYDPGSP